MTGWVIMVLLAVAVAVGLLRWFRRDLGAMQFLGAALLLALAGYAWQGRPGLAGAPKAQAAQAQRGDSDFAALRRDLLGQFNRTDAWLLSAEALNRSGETLSAVNLIRTQIDKSPRDMVLWLGLADALIQHAGGALTPAAEMAFNRAAQLAPDHPAPRFFYGIAMARMGQFEAAEQYWQQVLALPQTTDNWRNAVASAREAAARMRAMAAGAPPMQ